jgi:putative addiction module component (TIGR02574 family)
MERISDWKEQAVDLLSPSQRIELAMDLWDSVTNDHISLPISEAQMSELRHRTAQLDGGQMETPAWNDVKHRLLRDPL